MTEEATARGLFHYYYSAVNLIRMVQHGRSDPENIRGLIREATNAAKGRFPQYADQLDEAASEYNSAIDHGIKLKAASHES
ncbi:hypothetical protein GGR88_001365 [Sphingomonas jejuensis]|uniref:Uncharacterized protein n=1 Tax=Sphingomonas jejuensis TaxID=904715 RepID=A0ABX0XMH7_9SPHN|nr:hypothetical protein [Sphingomonas jejuensis]NJC33891.1 hypothetical protein [Sphingomonas jejuensis]